MNGITATGLTTPAVGGSGFTDGGVTAWINGSTTLTLVTDFVNQVAGSRLDFLSTHFYGSCAGTTLEEFTEYLGDVRGALDSAEPGVPLLLTEWNIGTGSGCGIPFFEQAEVGSFVAAAQTLMQDPAFDVERAYYYDGAPLMGPFTMDVNTLSFEVRPAGFALRAHSQLARGTAVAVSLCDAAASNCSDATTSAADGEPIVASGATLSSGEHVFVLQNHSDTARTASVQFDPAEPALTTYSIERTPAALTGSVSLARSAAPSGTRIPTPVALQQLAAEVITSTGTGDAGGIFVSLDPWEIVVLRAYE